MPIRRCAALAVAWLAACSAFAEGLPAPGQAADPAAAQTEVDADAIGLPVLSLDQAIAEAQGSGDDFAIAAGTLEVAKRQRAFDLSKQGLNVGLSGSYQLSDGLGRDGSTGDALSSALTSYDQGLISKAVTASLGSSAISSYAGVSQLPQGSLTLSGPLTKASLNFSQYVPVASPSDATTPTPTFSTPPTSVFGLNLSQTVWDGYPGFQYSGVLRQSLLAYQGKALANVQSLSSAVAKVKQSYVAMLAAQRDLEVKRQVLSKQELLLKQIQATYDMKQATAIDLKTAQVNAQSAAIDVEVAEKTLRLANERLAVIIGRKPDESFVVANIEDPRMPASSVEEAIDIGLKKRTDVAQLDLSARSSRISADIAAAQSRPTVSLVGGAGVAVGWSPYTVAGALSVGGKIGLPIYDSGAADRQSALNETQAALFDEQSAQLRKTIVSDIRDYFESARLQLKKVALAKDSMDLADAQFELEKAQNKFGTATVQDLLTASVTAMTAEVNYQTARSAYLTAVLQLSTAMGL